MTVTNKTIVVFDDFHRSDRLLRGDMLPTGQIWGVSGAGYLTAAIKNNLMVSDDYIYSFVVLPSRTFRFGGKFSWAGDPGTPAGITLISANGVGGLLDQMIHTYIDSSGINPTWWDVGTSQNNPLANCTGNPYFVPELTTSGAISQVYVTITGNIIHFEGSNGLKYDCTDPHVGTLSGSVLIWEITGDATYNRSRFHEVEADN